MSENNRFGLVARISASIIHPISGVLAMCSLMLSQNQISRIISNLELKVTCILTILKTLFLHQSLWSYQSLELSFQDGFNEWYSIGFGEEMFAAKVLLF